MSYDGFNKKIYQAWNSFSPDSGSWYECFACKKNHANCLHHNFGRAGKKSEKSEAYNSIFNSVPINNEECHLPRHSTIKRNLSWLERVYRIVRRAVQENNYTLSQRDKNWLILQKKTYEKININITELL